MIRGVCGLFFGWALLLAGQAQAPPPAQLSEPRASQKALDPKIIEAASQLALRISSLLPRRATASFEFQVRSPIVEPEWLSFRSRLVDELARLGIKTSGLETPGAPTTATPPEPQVHVTLSENQRGELLVAEVFTGDSRQVAILPWNAPSPAAAKPAITVTKKDLWAQPEPILDLALADSDSEMLVLGIAGVSSYRLTDGKWAPGSTAALLLPRPMPRDPRGRLELSNDQFRVYLPAGTCEGAWKPELKVSCASGTSTWRTAPVHWVADRNLLEGDASAPSFEGWGSDGARIADPCGAGTVVIASSPNNEHDSVRVYQVTNGPITNAQASPASDEMHVAGPVTALWPAESSREATLVVHNLQTGEYEASRLGVACSR